MKQRVILGVVLVSIGAPPALAGGGFGPVQRDLVLSDVESWGLQGDPENVVLSYDIGAGGTISGLGWNVTIATASEDTWVSDLQFRFYDSSGTTRLTLTPGAGVDEPGTMFFASDGVLDLTDNDIPNITLGDGLLLIEVLERRDDRPGAVDTFVSGVLTIEGSFVAPPAPGGAALFGVAGVIAARRRR